MLPLRLLIVAVAVFASSAIGSNAEVLDVTFYGFDEQNDPTEPETIDAVIPSDLPPSSIDGSQPTSLPDSSESRRDGRRHHHHRGRHHHRNHGNGMRRGWSGNWTDEQKLTYVCSKLQSRDTSASTDETTSGYRTGGGRHRPGLQWKLRALNETSRQTIVNAWERRRQEMLRCCNQGTLNAKTRCVNSTRAARYDRVCSNDEPLCYWSLLMPTDRRQGQTTPATQNNETNSVASVTTRCCAVRGTARVNCFLEAKNIYRQRMLERARQSNPHGGRGNSRDRSDRRRGNHESI